MDEKLCPDCDSPLIVTDGEYDTHYFCNCGFTANSDVEYDLTLAYRNAGKHSNDLAARITALEAERDELRAALADANELVARLQEQVDGLTAVLEEYGFSGCEKCGGWIPAGYCCPCCGHDPSFDER